MTDNINQILIKPDTEPSPFLPIEEGETNIFASMSSDLSEASGQKLLVKSALKKYIDTNLKNDKEVLDNFIYSTSNLISTPVEKKGNYIVSYKPDFFTKISGGVEIQLKNSELVFDKQGIVKILSNRNLLIKQSKIDSMLSSMMVDTSGCEISDSDCDGSEKSKYLDTIYIINVIAGSEIDSNNESYQYFKCNDEIFYGKINLYNNRIEKIIRGNIINNGVINEMKPLNTGSNMYMLNAIRVYYDVSKEDFDLYPNKTVAYAPIYQRTGLVENDTYFSTKDKNWYIYKSGLWVRKENYIYLGDILYYKGSFVGFSHNDTKYILDNISNIELKVSKNTIYTNSDKTYVTVLNKFVEFEIDRLRWNVEDYIENREAYLYIDGDGKTWCDTMKPIFVNMLGYSKHYYHYWRCVGKVEFENNEWVLKEI